MRPATPTGVMALRANLFSTPLNAAATLPLASQAGLRAASILPQSQSPSIIMGAASVITAAPESPATALRFPASAAQAEISAPNVESSAVAPKKKTQGGSLLDRTEEAVASPKPDWKRTFDNSRAAIGNPSDPIVIDEAPARTGPGKVDATSEADADSYALRTRPNIHPGAIDGFRFSSDGRTLFGNEAQIESAWDARTGKKLFERSWHNVKDVTADGLLAEDFNDWHGPRLFKLFDPATRQEKLAIPGWYHGKIDDQHYAIEQPGGSYAILDLKSLRLTEMEGTPYRYSRNGELILALGYGTTFLAGTKSGRAISPRLQGMFVAASPDLSRVVMRQERKTWWGRRVGDMVLYDMPSGKELYRAENYRFAVFSKDGRFVAFDGSREERMTVAKARTGEVLFAPDGKQTVDQFSPDGKYLVGLSEGGSSPVWQTQTGRIWARLPGIFQGFSPDGKTAAVLNVTGNSSRLLLWDIETETQKSALDLGPGGALLSSIHFSPDAKRLLVEYLPGALKDSAQLWDTETGRLVQEIPSDWGVTISKDWSLAVARTHSGVRAHPLK